MKCITKTGSASICDLRSNTSVHLRFLCPEDQIEVKRLCSDWFPVEYPECWYEEITSNPKFFSLAAVLENKIVGVVVSEIKVKSRIHKEDADILALSFPSHTQVAYILSLGVVERYRRQGIASLLLDSLISYLTSGERANVKAVYLHVLASNNVALKFYEHRSFKRHNYLPYYYSIDAQPKDGLCYVMYINGGAPPWSLVDYIKHFGSQLSSQLSRIQPSNLPNAVMRRTRNWFSGIIPARLQHGGGSASGSGAGSGAATGTFGSSGGGGCSSASSANASQIHNL
ncbi:N-alpha-acetyltransferase 60-like [Saccoglossus kowalevskii]|uniref:N-alpha-acetyltransferase 60 n=1 Tax=Saccoglossus kowalevskii TaxID=10224 RepID=A0ABM0MWP0_SACKO|nr:PREDICTED: N-alpha-acetyltransferase 60-like [Saccoglossus kowalevskii]